MDLAILDEVQAVHKAGVWGSAEETGINIDVSRTNSPLGSLVMASETRVGAAEEQRDALTRAFVIEGGADGIIVKRADGTSTLISTPEKVVEVTARMTDFIAADLFIARKPKGKVRTRLKGPGYGKPQPKKKRKKGRK